MTNRRDEIRISALGMKLKLFGINKNEVCGTQETASSADSSIGLVFSKRIGTATIEALSQSREPNTTNEN